MKPNRTFPLVAMAMSIAASALADDLTLETAPPVVVKTVPTAGTTGVDPNLTEIQATFSKPMMDRTWSWSTWGEENYPETTGEPRYLANRRICSLPVKLQPGRFYAIWLNSDRFKGFKDAIGNAAVPYLLTFTTASRGVSSAGEAEKRIVVDRSLFSEVYPAVWFCPATGETIPIKNKSERAPEAKYEIWIEPRDPEFSFGEVGLLGSDAEKIGFALVGYGPEAFAKTEARPGGKLDPNLAHLTKQSPPADHPVFYCRARHSECLIMIAEMNPTNEVISFHWKPLSARAKPSKPSAEAAGVAVLRPIPKAEELPGKLTFHGRYQHRSRGGDIATPSELWLNESPDGSVSALTRLPFSESAELASGNREHQIISHRIGRDAGGGQGGYRVELEFTNATARLTRRGIRQDCDGKELNVPDGAFFDPNTRPDSYLAANILLRALALREGETKDFPVFDWDNSGEEFASYTIRVRHAGKEKVEVPAGTFEANHLVLTQVTSADTWFKKRAGHITDFWVLDNGVIVRVLRHREPYEMVLLDHTVPENLGALPGTQGQGTAAKFPASKAAGPAQPILEMPRASEPWQTNLNADQRAVLAWTDRQFRGFFDQRTFAGWSQQERADLEQHLLDALNGPRTREYYQAINSLAALGSTKALPALRALAFDRQDKDNRDRWMAIRALGILGDRSAIPNLIPLVYHGNPNTHWWAQLSLVRLTGQNFGSDWSAWGKWWNASGGQPPYQPEIIRWWNGQAEDAQLAETLAESDRKFFESIGVSGIDK